LSHRKKTLHTKGSKKYNTAAVVTKLGLKNPVLPLAVGEIVGMGGAKKT